jgi:hypothetical protein
MESKDGFFEAFNDWGLVLAIFSFAVLVTVIVYVVRMVNRKGKNKDGMVHNKKPEDRPRK